jgi:hypothetical protein
MYVCYYSYIKIYLMRLTLPHLQDKRLSLLGELKTESGMIVLELGRRGYQTYTHSYIHAIPCSAISLLFLPSGSNVYTKISLVSNKKIKIILSEINPNILSYFRGKFS